MVFYLLFVVYGYILIAYVHFVNTFLLPLVTFLLISVLVRAILSLTREVICLTQGERIKEIRKSLNLTLEKFGEKIGVTKTAISRIEKGERGCTEQMTKAICREFGVDYIWLTTGEGEMFVDSDDDFIEKIDRIMAGESDIRKNAIKALVNASTEDIEALDRLIDLYLQAKNEKD